jgi:signal transduction histidine kinase
VSYVTITARASIAFAVLALALPLFVVARVAAGGGAERAPLWLDASSGPVGLRPYLEMVEDSGRELTITDVTSPAFAPRFRPLDRTNAGLGTSAYWLRFSVARAADAPRSWVLELTNTPQTADLFVPGADGWSVRRSGASLPFGQREVAEPCVAFVVEPPALHADTYYVRVTSDDTVNFAFELEPERVAAAQASSRKLAGGMYYGAMIVLIAYNVFLFAATRDKAYLSYACFELVWILTQASMDKYAFQYLWPDAPAWAFRSEQVFASLGGMCSLAFARAFLSLETHAPRTDRAARGLEALGLLLAIVSAVSQRSAVVAAVNGYGLVCIVLLLATGARLAVRRTPNALLYLVAWSFLAMGCTLVVADSVGILPARDVLVPLKLGSLIEALILSLGLARRVDSLRRQREVGEARLARARESRLAALGRLVAGFAHEVGNPLNFALGGAVEVTAQVEAAAKSLASAGEPGGDHLQSARESVAAARKAAELVLEGNERIKRLLDNLRCYVRARDVPAVPTDLAAAVRSTLVMAAPLLERTRTSVHLQLAKVPAVDARPGEIEQVLMNLVVNACQAMAEGGEIVVSTRITGNRACVEISDSGPGIPQSRRETIFEPFYTTHESDSAGRGLGLYVSHDIVARHGGDLRVEDSAVGARFVVELPLPVSAAH